MQDDNVEVISGSDYFATDDAGSFEPEANGDTTSPIGDIDSESVVDQTDDSVDDHDEDATDESVDETDDLDPQNDADTDDAEDEWLPGFEGRFRPGEEGKALASYKELESEFSRRQNEFQQQLERERELAFEQAAKLMQQQQAQGTQGVLQQLQERQQLTQLAIVDPGTAFKAALAGGNEETINAVIQAVSTGDLELGIEGDYSAAMQMQGVVSELKNQSQVQSLQHELQQMRAQTAIENATTQFKSQYGQALEHPDLAEAFQRSIEANWNTMQNVTDPAEVTYLLERSLQQAVGQVALTQGYTAPSGQTTTQQAQQRPAKRRPHTETGAVTRSAPPAEKTESEEYASEILAAARHLKPVY